MERRFCFPLILGVADVWEDESFLGIESGCATCIVLPNRGLKFFGVAMLGDRVSSQCSRLRKEGGISPYSTVSKTMRENPLSGQNLVLYRLCIFLASNNDIQPRHFR